MAPIVAPNPNQSPPQPDDRLPIGEAGALMGGFIGMAVGIASGNDPLQALNGSLANAMLKVGGVDKIREELAHILAA